MPVIPLELWIGLVSGLAAGLLDSWRPESALLVIVALFIYAVVAPGHQGGGDFALFYEILGLIAGFVLVKETLKRVKSR